MTSMQTLDSTTVRGQFGSVFVARRRECLVGRVAAVGLATVALCLMCVGCGGSNNPKTIPVHGKLTFSNGAPPAAGMLFFAPLRVEEGYPRRSGRAAFDTDGLYEVTSWQEGDGLVPGEYTVRVECWKSKPVMGGSPGVSYVAATHKTENLTVDVDQDEIEHDLNVRLAE